MHAKNLQSKLRASAISSIMVNLQLCSPLVFLPLLLHQRGIRACDPRQFSFQLDCYQQRSYQDPSSNLAVRSLIKLKSISWPSIMLTGADLRV